MTSATLSSMKSTIVRNMPTAAALRAYFATASRIVPRLAKAHAERLFTLPPRHAHREAQAPDARRETVTVGRHHLAVWHDGAPEAPAVLLAHGWGGRGAQMAGLVAPLREPPLTSSRPAARSAFRSNRPTRRSPTNSGST